MTLMRLLLLSLLVSSINISIASVRSKVMEAQLKKDSFEFYDVAYPEPNPLRRLIYPSKSLALLKVDLDKVENQDAILNSLPALNYQFHAWSEVIEGGYYPIYRWVRKENTTDDDNNPSARFVEYITWGDFSEDSFFAELNEEDREKLIEALQRGDLVGGLTHTSAANLTKDSEKFKLVLLSPLNLKGTLKAENVQVEKSEENLTPKMEAPKVEAPKVEAPKVEAPKVEAPKVEAPKVEAPKVEAPKVEAPKVDLRSQKIPPPPIPLEVPVEAENANTVEQPKRLIPPPPIPTPPLSSLSIDKKTGFPIAKEVPGMPHHVYRINPKPGELTILRLEIVNSDPNDKTVKHPQTGVVIEDPISGQKFVVP